MRIIASLITVISFLLIITVGDSVSEQVKKKKTGSEKTKRGEYEQLLEKCKGGVDLSQADDAIKKGKESIESCNKAIKLKPNDAMAYFYTGVIYVQIGHNFEKNSGDMAIEFLTKAIELKPTDTEIHSLAYNIRGVVYSDKIGNHKKAIENFNKALEIMPDNTLAKNNLEKAQKLADAEEKIKTLTENLKEKPDVYDNYYELAKVYAGLNKYKKVTENLDKYLEGVKDNHKAFIFRGWAKWKLNDNNGAYEDYNKAIELEPNDADNYYWRSFTYDSIKERDKKIADLRKALELEPNHKDALWGLAKSIEPVSSPLFAKVSNEDVEDAINTFSKLIELDPNYDKRIYKFRADLYMTLNPPDCQNAITDMKKTVEIMPDNDWAFQFLAEDYRNCKDYDFAIKTYENIIKKDDKFFKWKGREGYLIELAKTYMIKNDVKIDDINEAGKFKNKDELIEAVDTLNKAIQLLPLRCPDEKNMFSCEEKKVAFGYLGLTYESLGWSEKALESFINAIKISPLNSAMKTHIALIYYYDKKDYEKALDNCEMSIKEKLSWREEFGNLSCNESFIGKIKDKVVKQKEDKQRYAKYKKYIDLYKSTLPPEMKNCSWNVRTVNEVTKLSISETLYIVYQDGLGITEVKLSSSISQELSAMVKQRGLKINMDIDLPFYVWFVDNVMGESLDQSATGLCYFSALLRKSQFDVIQTFVNGYLDSIKKKT